MKAKIIPIGQVRTSGYNAVNEKADNVIGSKIAEARKYRGLSLRAFVEELEKVGVSVNSSAASKWENGSTVPNAYQLIAITHLLNIDDGLAYFKKEYAPLLNEAGARKVEEYRADLIASGKYKPLTRSTASIIRYIEKPVSNLPVSAGTGAFLDEENFEMISFPEDKVPADADFGVRVSGDSMEPVYHDGQIVWVQRCEQVGIGQVGVFIYDGDGYLKCYNEREPDKAMAEEFTDCYGNVHAQPVMESYNAKYAPKYINPNAAFQVIGRVL